MKWCEVKRSEAKRSEAKRSEAKRSEAKSLRKERTKLRMRTAHFLTLKRNR